MQPAVAPRGFVTIATGAPKYYEMALRLLHSYRLNGNSSLPFALICDKDCEAAREFDDVVILPEPHYSFLDKLSLCNSTPYQETIFIDADSLVLKNLNPLWDDYADEEDFSCYGCKLPLESRDGWFYYEGMGKLQPLLKYNVSLHGGMYYLRKTARCQEIFRKAVELVDEYQDYSFYYFKKPADEPVLALSMALNGGHPCSKPSRIVFFNTHKEKIRTAVTGKLSLFGKACDPHILHFGARNIPRFLYQYQSALVEKKLQDAAFTPNCSTYLKVWMKCLPFEIKYRSKKALKKILPAKVISILKKSL
jgi:hypothetical protein